MPGKVEKGKKGLGRVFREEDMKVVEIVREKYGLKTYSPHLIMAVAYLVRRGITRPSVISKMLGIKYSTATTAKYFVARALDEIDGVDRRPVAVPVRRRERKANPFIEIILGGGDRRG